MLQKLQTLLIPGFLRKLDHYLLLNYRVLWMSQVHYVLYYGLISYALLALFIALYPASPAHFPGAWVFAKFAYAPAFLAFAGWLYRQSRYSAANQPGVSFKRMDQLRLLLNIFCISAFAFFPVSTYDLTTQRIAGLQSPQEIIHDINTLNLGNPYFSSLTARDSLFEKDMTRLCKRMVDETGKAVKTGGNQCWGNNRCRNVHYNFSGFSYQIISTFYNLGGEHVGTMDSLLLQRDELEKIVLSTRDDATRLKRIENYLAVMEKYGYPFKELSPQQILSLHKEGKTHLYKHSGTHDYDDELSYLKDGVRNQAESLLIAHLFSNRNRTREIFEFLLIVFTTATAVLIHQKTGWKTTVVVALLGILTIVVLIVAKGDSHYRIKEQAFWILFTVKVVTLIGLVGWQLWRAARVRHFSRFLLAITGLANVMAAFLITFLFVFLLELPQDILPGAVYGFSFNLLQKVAILAGNFLFYFLFLNPLFQKLYAKLNALPEK